MKKILAILIAVFFLSGQQMQAGDKEWSVVGKVLTGIFAIKVLDDITTPKTVVTHHVSSQPVVVHQPQPVIVQQPAVVYQPAPVVVYQSPVVHCQPPVVIHQHYRPRRGAGVTFHWHGH